MVGMRRTPRWSVVAAVVFAAVGFPAAAYAAYTELGATRSPIIAPVCPPGVSSANCTIILTRVTALETLRDGVAYPTKVTRAGRITAFTVGLSNLSSSKATRKSFIHYLDATYGGTTRLAVTVLRRGGGKKTDFRWKVVGESAIYHVQPYLGSVVQIPLESTIEVKPGDVIALTTPTWAPILTIDVDSKKFAYRQSRSTNCSSPPATSQAQLSSSQTANYQCDYPGTRLEYSATEVYYPLGANPVH
jgi:hypothetical protein